MQVCFPIETCIAVRFEILQNSRPTDVLEERRIIDGDQACEEEVDCRETLAAQALSESRTGRPTPPVNYR